MSEPYYSQHARSVCVSLSAFFIPERNVTESSNSEDIFSVARKTEAAFSSRKFKYQGQVVVIGCTDKQKGIRICIAYRHKYIKLTSVRE